MMKKLVCFLLALCIMSAALAGCSSGQKDANVQPDGQAQREQAQEKTEESAGRSKITVGVSSTFDNLSPFTANSSTKATILNGIYMHLGMRDGFGGEMQGALMKEWVQEDPYTYVITLYDYITDSEGNPFTASDVVFCFQTAKELGYIGEMSYVESCSQVDNYTVKLVLNSDGLGVFEDVVLNLFMVTEAAYMASGDDQMATSPVGTGPYRITNFTAGATMTVEKYDGFWQEDAALLPRTYHANVDEIQFDVISEASQMGVALETGTIQLGWTVQTSELYKFEGNENFTISKISNNVNHTLLFNCTEGSVFEGNTALRQAVLYAIDQNALVAACLNGYGSPAKAFGTTIYEGYNDAWLENDYYGYDLEKAKELMAEAGYPDGGITVRLMINTGNVQKLASEVIQNQLAAIGITVKIDSFDVATYLANRDASANMYDIALVDAGSTGYLVTAWGTVLDNSLFSSGATMFGLKDDTLQALVETAKTSKGNTQENINAIYNYITDNAYAYGTYYDYKYCVHTTDITEVYFDGHGNVVPNACTFQ